MANLLNKIRSFKNSKVDASIINDDQLDQLVLYALDVIEKGVEGDFVEFGCYVGESSKYLRKTLDEWYELDKIPLNEDLAVWFGTKDLYVLNWTTEHFVFLQWMMRVMMVEVCSIKKKVRNLMYYLLSKKLSYWYSRSRIGWLC